MNAWDGVLGIIQNLRPTLLDDLGLIAAINWLLDIHLGQNGVNCYINTGDVADKPVPPGDRDHAVPDHPGGGGEHFATRERRRT